MIKYLTGVVFIFIMTCVAWVILGSSVYFRTYEKEGLLENRVENLWGGTHSQASLEAFYEETNNKKINIPIEKSDIRTQLMLSHRQKGLLWYPTYKVRFEAKHLIKNPTENQQKLSILVKFPNPSAIYDNFRFKIGSQEYSGPVNLQRGITWGNIAVRPGEEFTVQYSYNSQGLKQWFYIFPTELSSIKNFNLQMETDFKDIDFPEGTLSPSNKVETSKGWELEWNYKNLISDLKIGMELPQKLNPGPLVAKVTFYAPIGLFFFLTVVFLLTLIKEIKIHPMNYFFICAAFFGFHLLFAYLIDHLSINTAFLISATISLILVVNYLHLFTSWRIAILYGGISQLIYLIFFSYSFFFKGFTGLTITIVAIITLAFLMQLTGRINWAEKLKRQTPTLT